MTLFTINTRIAFAIVFYIVLISPLMAEELQGKVISISDGDTLSILTQANKEIRIRLAAIDAPEKSQPFGQQSKQALSDLCYKKHASVLVVDKDRYGRSVGEVSCNGRYANQVMLAEGMAWVYRKYAEGYAHFYRVEEAAKAQETGLWSEANPIPPWEYRKQRR